MSVLLDSNEMISFEYFFIMHAGDSSSHSFFLSEDVGLVIESSKLVDFFSRICLLNSQCSFWVHLMTVGRMKLNWHFFFIWRETCGL